MLLVSPYLKTLSMVASTKLLHLLEAFSTPWFLFSSPTNHHLVFFLLEIFNNIIQYQFDGNSNLVYTIIRKRQVFHALANLPCDYGSISRSLTKRAASFRSKGAAAPGASGTISDSRPASPATGDRALITSSTSHESLVEEAMEGSHPAQPAEPGTLKATLPDTPAIGQMTEKESAHPQSQPPSYPDSDLTAITTQQQQQNISNDGDETPLKLPTCPTPSTAEVVEGTATAGIVLKRSVNTVRFVLPLICVHVRSNVSFLL